jgi:hypothetical protein
MSREVMQQALEALESFQIISEFTPALAVHAIADLRAELAKPEQRMCPNTYYECSRGCGDGPCKAFYDAYDIKEKS